MIDRLIEKIQALRAPIVVGLDPAPELLPEYLRGGDSPKRLAQSYLAFNREIIDAVQDIVPAVKPQVAMYESLGPEGLSAYIDTVAYAQSKGLVVIGDIKRGDIASTAAAYARHLTPPWNCDAVTLNPYLGGDSVQPFLDICAKEDRGVFVLVKTSNPGGGDLQDLKLESGLRVYEHMADLTARWGAHYPGRNGYSKVCAVVGATYPEQGAALRARAPRTFFLAPGYGAQGASGRDLRGFFDKNKSGCIVNSSRGIIAAWKKTDGKAGPAAREAALRMRQDLRDAGCC